MKIEDLHKYKELKKLSSWDKVAEELLISRAMLYNYLRGSHQMPERFKFILKTKLEELK